MLQSLSPRTADLTKSFMDNLSSWHDGETEFLQAVEEVVGDVITVEKANAGYTEAKLLERLTEADRVISFRVLWQDDAGQVQINRGWRVQHCNALGPYKGGLRFDPSVTRSVLKFLAYEQTFKNALTGLPLGGAKGGADFDPKGKSDAEVMRFCQAFMGELFHHIGPYRDIPAGDMGVGAREIGYLAGAYKRYSGEVTGAMTGKSLCMGGSLLRTEATGYGLVYFLCAMLGRIGEDVTDKRIAISGMGNVASHAAEKAIEMGGRVISLSNSSGTLFAPDGLTKDALDWIMARRAAGEEVTSPPKELLMSWMPGKTPWTLGCDIALPCATQNEIDADAAQALVDGDCKVIAEGANMPLTAEAQDIVRAAGIPFAPGKAANAGGVAVSGLEMRQNASFNPMTREAVDQELREIMVDMHSLIVAEANSGVAESKAGVDYRRGANIAAYRRVAKSLLDHGVI